MRTKNRLYDQQTLEVMRRVLGPASNCVDGGAHEGALLQHMVEIAPGGHHHAFEPLPAHADRLRDRFPSVEVHQVALSDEAGRATFRHVLDAPAHSGFTGAPWHNDDAERIDLIEVDLVRLDDTIPPEHPIDLIKLDVEGSEVQALRGAKALLQRDRPVIVVEVGVDAHEVFALFTSYGFAVSRLDDWLAGRPLLDEAGYRAAVHDDWYYLAHPL